MFGLFNKSKKEDLPPMIVGSIHEQISHRYIELYKEIPLQVNPIRDFLKNERLNSDFNQLGTIKHIICLKVNLIIEEARDLLRQTHFNPYLTDQEKLKCLLEDTPEQYIKEIYLKKAEEYQSEQIEIIAERDKKYERKILIQDRIRKLAETLNAIPDAVIEESINQIKNNTGVMSDKLIRPFIESITVEMVRAQIPKSIEKYEDSASLELNAYTHNLFINKTLSTLIYKERKQIEKKNKVINAALSI
jgi:hypothetical protein